jgi:hypothetical protein
MALVADPTPQVKSTQEECKSREMLLGSSISCLE